MTLPTAAASTTRRKFCGICPAIVFPWFVRFMSVYGIRRTTPPRVANTLRRKLATLPLLSLVSRLIISRQGFVRRQLAGTDRIEQRRQHDRHYQVEEQCVESRIAREGVAPEGKRVGGLELRGDGHRGTGIGADGPADEQRPGVTSGCRHPASPRAAS